MPSKVTKNVRKIIQISQYSYGITLPVDDLRALGWKEKQKVVVRREDDRFIIEDWKEK